MAPAVAQSLLDTYRRAVEADPKYRAVLYTARATDALRDQAFAGFLPTLRFEAESIETRQRIISSENPIFGPGTTDFPTRTHTLSLVQPLFRKDVVERFEQAKASVQQASYTLLAAEQDLMLRTASAYLQVLAARDALAFSTAEREALGRALELAREKLKSGLGTITVLHDATARHALAQAREIESRNKLADARQALQEITGAEPQALQSLRADLPLTLPEPASLSAWLDAARDGNLSLRARAAAVEVASIEIDRQKAAHFPSVSMVYTQNRKDSGSTLFGGGSNVDTRELSLRLSVPLFEGGAVLAVTKEASFKHLKAREEHEQERRALERQTRSAYEALVSGVGLVQALAQSVVAQQSAVAAKEQGYAAGINTLLPVLDAQRDLFAARRDHAQARYDLLINRLKLAQAAGTLSETHMAEVGAALQ
ncbi:TolC family outer membrane protein [Ideonella sp. DXS22W]|uniref:TolC family outer membrane protein n=1 Tax=Pseudaquabacterium inlustre TaxID=2984192 RepID=A0ABU9CMF7_9BURK